MMHEVKGRKPSQQQQQQQIFFSPVHSLLPFFDLLSFPIYLHV